MLFVPEISQLRPRQLSSALVVGVLGDKPHDGQGPLPHPSVVAPLNYLLALAVSPANGLLLDPGCEVQRDDPTIAVV